jgi:hypothetical protein
MKVTEKGIKMMMREQYESLIYRTLIESEIKEKDIMNAKGLEVTRKRDSSQGKKGEKLTISSVERQGGSVVIKLVSPENVVAPTAASNAGMNQPTQDYNLEDFESHFEI